MIKGMSVFDWSMLVVTAISVISGYLSRMHRLSPEARKWISEVGEPVIRDIASEAAQLSELSGDQRREYAVARLQQAAEEASGGRIPASIANYLVEHAYQWIRRRK